MTRRDTTATVDASSPPEAGARLPPVESVGLLGRASVNTLENPETVSGEDVLPGIQLNLQEIW